MTDDNRDWLKSHKHVNSLRLATSDLNGTARGKRIPVAHADKAFEGGLRMPLSTLNVDIWGEDIADSPLVFASGDGDGCLRPTSRGLVPMDWFSTPSAFLPLWMFTDNGAPFLGDPRHALARVIARYKARGLTPVVATELEFYLLDGKSARPSPPRAPLSGQVMAAKDVLALSGLDAFDDFFTDLYAACAAMDIPADAAISEGGLGQFEINLLHSNDAMKAADDAWLFKIATRGIARKHGFAASFMAKPYIDQPGNGMHTHFSVLDVNKVNVFDDGSELGSDTMRHAVGGLMRAMSASTLIFAPHANSYRRMAPDSHAPTKVCWGYENRTAAIRIPGGNPVARRIEHRVAGGDVNPYLMLTAVLGAALLGIEDKFAPSPAITGSAYDLTAETLPATWQNATDLFANDAMVARIFAPTLIENLVLQKRQEIAVFKDAPQDFEFTTYLETV
ncbi:MAG: glutamine synthetase [Alphaproteobacteria bacterium]|nr:glutamine synthetase [Alphaproteobacteria bacterium]